MFKRNKIGDQRLFSKVTVLFPLLLVVTSIAGCGDAEDREGINRNTAGFEENVSEQINSEEFYFKFQNDVGNVEVNKTILGCWLGVS